MNHCRPAIHGFHEKDRVCRLKKKEKKYWPPREATRTRKNTTQTSQSSSAATRNRGSAALRRRRPASRARGTRLLRDGQRRYPRRWTRRRVNDATRCDLCDSSTPLDRDEVTSDDEPTMGGDGEQSHNPAAVRYE
jgi:hypothetical protein